MNSEDINKLLKFLSDLKSELTYIVEITDWIFKEHLREPYYKAWPKVNKAINSIKNNINTSIDDLMPFLEQAGLAGEQLNLKLAGFSESSKYWHRCRDIRFYSKSPKPRVRWKKALKSMLGWALIILGSLSRGLSELRIPVELVKEFVESLKQSVEDLQ